MIPMPDTKAATISCFLANHEMDPKTQDALRQLLDAAVQYMREQVVIAALCSPWGRLRT